MIFEATRGASGAEWSKTQAIPTRTVHRASFLCRDLTTFELVGFAEEGHSSLSVNFILGAQGRLNYTRAQLDSPVPCRRGERERACLVRRSGHRRLSKLIAHLILVIVLLLPERVDRS